MLDDGCQSSGLNPSCHPSSYFKLAYLPSSWQLDGLYTPSLILPLDFRLGAAAPSWCTPSASWAHLGRKHGLPTIFKTYCFFIGFSSFFETQARPTSDKMRPKTLDEAPRVDFGRWSYISGLSWAVLASILEGLGVDFVPLEALLGSNMAPKIAPEPS